MLTEEAPRRRPHEVVMRGVRPTQPAEAPGPAPVDVPRKVHRLRRIRQVSVQAISEIDQALS